MTEITGRRDGDAVSDPRREVLAERLYNRFHGLMAWLAALFVLVVLGDTFVRSESPYATILTVAGWVIWALFALEFVLRFAIAPDKSRFLRRSGWQAIFLVFPFLGLIRLAVAFRVARAGRVVSAAVRGTRTASSLLTSRLAWIFAVTVIVILLGTDLAYELAGIRPYGAALHAVALAAIAGVPLGDPSGVAQILDVFLLGYSVVIFAGLAGTVGAYFLEHSPNPDRKKGRGIEPAQAPPSPTRSDPLRESHHQ